MQVTRKRTQFWTVLVAVGVVVVGVWLWRTTGVGAQSNGGWWLFSPTTTNVVVDSIAVDLNEAGDVGMRITTGPGEVVASGTFLIDFDPSIVSYVSSAIGTGDLALCNIIEDDDVPSNRERLQCSYVNVIGTSGTDVLLFTMTFQGNPTTDGISPLELNVTILTDASGLSVDRSATDGEIVVGSPATPTPTATSTSTPTPTPTPTNTPTPTPTPTSTPVPDEDFDNYLPLIQS